MTVPHVSAGRVHVARALRGRGARAKRRAVRWRVDARQGRLGGGVNAAGVGLLSALHGPAHLPRHARARVHQAGSG